MRIHRTSILVVLCILIVAAVCVFSCSENDPEQAVDATNLSNPDDITLNLTAEPIEGTFAYLITAVLIDPANPDSPTNTYIRFTPSSGTIYPSGSFTDSDGRATMYFHSSFPGPITIYAECIYNRNYVIASCEFAIPGEKPTLVVMPSENGIGAAGSPNWVTISASFRLPSDNPCHDMQLSFWCSGGCFHHGCNSILYTDVSGFTSQTWYPPLWGLDNDNDIILGKRAAFRDILITVMYLNDDQQTEYEGSAVIRIYPLRAKLKIGTMGPKDDPVTTLTASVYWTDGKTIFPQEGIYPEFTIVSDGNAYLNFYNNSRTVAVFGLENCHYASVTATIDEKGPGDCCFGKRDGWFWSDSFIWRNP